MIFIDVFTECKGGHPPLIIINLDLFSLREEKLKLWQPDVLSYISRHHVQFVLLSLPLLEHPTDVLNSSAGIFPPSPLAG